MRINIRVLALISPALSARLVNYLWFKTRRFTEPRREQRLLELATWQTQKVEKNTIQIYIWGERNKPTVLLVHGWNGRGAQLGAFAHDLVSKGYRVITFDAPGHGRSSSNETNLLEISNVIQQLEHRFGPFHAGISHSFGGLCLMHAVHTGIKIDKVVCIASAYNVERLVQIFARIFHVPETVVEQQKRLLEHKFGNDLWQQFSVPDIVKKTDAKGLIIHDEKDEDIPVERSKMIAKDWVNSELVLTSGLGHRRILRNKTVINKVTAFICE